MYVNICVLMFQMALLDLCWVSLFLRFLRLTELKEETFHRCQGVGGTYICFGEHM